MLVAAATADDAGVVQLSDDIALVHTADFFTPIVDDPYAFGRIAATNALSDIYAMGAEPVSALNLVAYPLETLGPELLAEILRGGLRRVAAAGAPSSAATRSTTRSRSSGSRSPASCTPTRCSPTPAAGRATRSC